jgi:phage/plasmid-like protein (TIGR03299 family)
MGTPEQTFELLERTGTNWTVNKLPLVGPDGQQTGSFGLFRNDTGNWLGTTGSRYTALQNFEMAEMLIDACQAVGLEAAKGGVLRYGARVFMQARLPKVTIGDSSVERYVTLLNSHDGSGKAYAGSTHMNMVCQNMFNRMIKEGGLSSFVHSATIRDRVQAAIRNIKMVQEQDNSIVEHLRRMADITITNEALVFASKGVFKRLGIELNDKLTPQRKKVIEDLHTSIGLELGRQGQTLWGLFNGFTHYTNHVQPKRTELQTDNVMVGRGKEMNDAAFETIMSWIDEHSVKSYAVA